MVHDPNGPKLLDVSRRVRMIGVLWICIHHVSSSSICRNCVVVWAAPAPVPAIDSPTTADEVPDPSETPLSSVSEKAVSSIGTSEDTGEASSTFRQFKWETPVFATTVGGLLATTVDEIPALSEISFAVSATPEGASRLVTGSE
jgi:hypothetical protein